MGKGTTRYMTDRDRKHNQAIIQGISIKSSNLCCVGTTHKTQKGWHNATKSCLLRNNNVETTNTDVGMTYSNSWEIKAVTWRRSAASPSLLLLTLIRTQRQLQASCQVMEIMKAVRLDRKWADNRKSLCPRSQTSTQPGSHLLWALWEAGDVTPPQHTHRRQTIAHSQSITALSRLSKFQRHTPHPESLSFTFLLNTKRWAASGRIEGEPAAGWSWWKGWERIRWGGRIGTKRGRERVKREELCVL